MGIIVLVSNDFIKQTKSKQLSKSIVDKIYSEFDNLKEIEKSGYNSLRNYLGNQNGKELKGSEHIYKYRLSDGDRILYTYSKYVDNNELKQKNALILLKYAKHDDQGNTKKVGKSQNYVSVSEISHDNPIVSAEDIKDFGIDNIEKYINLVICADNYKHQLYQLDIDKLKEGYAVFDELDYKLTPEQVDILEEYATNPCPLIILGGAGTGKTLIALHLLNDLSDSTEKECRYFTQSRELLNKVKNIYYNRLGNEEKRHVKFSEINEFCFHNLKENGIRLSRENLVGTTEFLEFISNNEEIKEILLKKEIHVFDIWTEIRGVIKGGLSYDWTRSTYIEQGNYSASLIKKLDSNKMIKRNPVCSKEFIPIACPLVLNEHLDSDEKKDLDKINEYYSSVDTSIIAMNEKEYFELDEEFSVIEKDNRKTIYSIFKIYQEWLERNDLFDENDLARKTMEITQLHQKIDYILIDEIQDYTELQIYLLKKLAKTENGIVYLGDQHQIINPTLFDERKLRNLHKDNVRVKKLTMNFRCQSEIVEICNAVASCRRSKVAMKKQNSEIDEKSVRAGMPNLWLDYSKDSIVNLMEKLIEYPNVAIIVAGEKEKKQLIGMYGKERYESADNPIVFSVSEIKGMEYQYVVCIDIISSHIEAWNHILDNSEAKKRTKYRYYFNLFYVGATRAQERLCIIEKTGFNIFYCAILNDENYSVKINQCKSLETDELGLNQLANAYGDWFNAAEDYFYNGKYDVALLYYKKAKAEQKYIYRCMAEIAIDNKDFENAIKYFVLLNDIERIKDYCDEEIKDENLSFIIKWMLESSNLRKYQNRENQTLYQRIERVYVDQTERLQAICVIVEHIKIRVQYHAKLLVNEVQ